MYSSSIDGEFWLMREISKVRVLTVAIAVIVVALAFGFIIYSNSPAHKLKKQLDLGQKYLNELNTMSRR